MCGIAGILTSRAAAGGSGRERQVLAALARLRHRGPDDQGLWRSDAVVLGHRRLSILDLTQAGHQPMRTADGRYACVLNGEIYNYLELRRELAATGHAFGTGTDTEVLLAAFAEWGIACLSRLRGQFAFAIWDDRTGRLWLARDRVGEKPLHVWRDRERLVFASEIKALLEMLPARPALSPDAINTYLHYQFVLEPKTPLEGIEKLPAGHVLEAGRDGWDAPARPYWSLGAAPPSDGEPVARLREALDEAVTLTLRSDAPVGIALSGGLDSGVIAALAARKRPDVMAFTVGYPGGREFDERRQARELASHLGIAWHGDEIATAEFVDAFPGFIDRLDEPIADTAAYAQFRVSQLASRHGAKVLLTGIGGDELFFGYAWVREALRLSRLKLALTPGSSLARAYARVLRLLALRTPALAIVANRRFPAWWTMRADRAFDRGKIDLDHPDEWVFYQLDYHWRPAVAFTDRIFAARFRERLAPRSAYRLMRGMASASPELEIEIVRLLFDSWLVSNCLDLGDRVSMASSIETRVPLLDARLIETTVGFWRTGRTEDALGHKTWLRGVAHGLLPPEVCDRPKLGFVTPAFEWTRAVNTRYRSRLLDGTLIAGGVIDPDGLRRWLDGTPPGIHRDFFQYKLTLLELWCRIVLHGERPEEIT